MAKPSVSEPSATPQPSARDSHGNQSHGTDGSASTASASREIFQGLFKDLGKQAMAMESILRLVCGKVDKLEHWVTEMSFGMTELDLKLRNIAHNIEGTAANVDDVASVSRWAVPVEDDASDAKAATATVIKKVGVGLHKKKQMRMTGMVANILDQLTTVAETPSMVESESEAHKNEDGGKKKKGKKAKDREKAKARGEHVGGGEEAVSLTKDHSPREAEPNREVKEKHKTHKKKKTDSQERSQPHEEMINTTPQEQIVVGEDGRQGEENVRQHDELKVDEKSHEDEKVVAQPQKENSEEIAHERVKEEAKAEEKGEREEETAPEQETQEQAAGVGESKEEVVAGVEAQKDDVAGEREPDKPVEIKQIAEYAEEIRATEADEIVEGATTNEYQDDKEKSVLQRVSLPAESAQSIQHSVREEPVYQTQPSAQPEATQMPMATSSAQVTQATDAASSSSLALDDKPAQPMETNTTEPAQPTASSVPLDAVQSSPVEQSTSRLLSPIPSSRAPADDVVVPATAPPPQPTAAPQQHAVPVIRPDLPAIRLEPLVMQESAQFLKPKAPDMESNTPVTTVAPATASNEPFRHPQLLTKASSKRLRNKNAPTSTEVAAETGGRSSPTKKGSRKASIRRSISQRQPSLKKRRSQIPPPEPQAIVEDTKAVLTVSPIQPPVSAVLKKPSTAGIPDSSTRGATHNDAGQEESSQEEDEDDDEDDDDDDDSSMLSSDSDGSVLDLGASGGSGAANESAATSAKPADKKMSSKITRTLTALNKLQKANVLSPDEIAELKQRATQKWFRLRDHVKEKNKKDVTNILLKRKKNIFTVSNRIELLEEKSREVYASIKQLNTELKSKLEASTFEGLRRHVHDIHASLQVLDQKISKGDIPTMEHVKQLATETENLRVMFLEQLAFARDHCDANHDETLKMFEEEWKRVTAIEKSVEEKLETLAAGFDAKILALPDYADALEGIRRAIRKKADLKVLRELEAKLLGHDGESEDCLIRCLSCHKEVTNTGGNDATNNEDNDVSVANSPHFKRVNPGTASAKVYRSNMPLSAQPLVISESTPELFSAPQTDEATTPNAKFVTPSRRATRNEEPRPSPLSFIHVTATRAMAAAADAGRPISAPSVAIKKKTPPTNTK